MKVSVGAQRSLDELTLGSGATLDELVDRGALREMADSFYELFRVPLRIIGEHAGLLADASSQPEIYRYLSGFKGGRVRLSKLIEAVKDLEPEQGEDRTYQCFTGAVYRVSAIILDGRRIGRLILGPFLPPSVKQVPRELLTLDDAIDPEKVKELLAKMPRARERTVAQIAVHLTRTLDLILFSGHKSLLTSSMHLASVRESFRDLEEKNTKLQEAYDKLQELDRLKSNFLATVSHELRTPLTSIIGYSEMLVEGIAGEINDDQKEFAATIHEKGKQLLELISGLLDLSKLESGTLALRKAEVQVDSLVQDVVQTLTPMARKKNVNVHGQSDPGMPTLLGDPTRLRQVLINLADNALKFTPPEGEVRITAQMSTMSAESDADDAMVLFAAEQPAVRITVADTGIGIPDDEKERVFNAFYQVDSGTTREAGGTGLGLSIVKRLVEGHQGTICVEDNTPTGAAFVVTIPFRHITLS